MKQLCVFCLDSPRCKPSDGRERCRSIHPDEFIHRSQPGRAGYWVKWGINTLAIQPLRPSESKNYCIPKLSHGEPMCREAQLCMPHLDPNVCRADWIHQQFPDHNMPLPGNDNSIVCDDNFLTIVLWAKNIHIFWVKTENWDLEGIANLHQSIYDPEILGMYINIYIHICIYIYIYDIIQCGWGYGYIDERNPGKKNTIWMQMSLQREQSCYEISVSLDPIQGKAVRATQPSPRQSHSMWVVCLWKRLPPRIRRWMDATTWAVQLGRVNKATWDRGISKGIESYSKDFLVVSGNMRSFEISCVPRHTISKWGHI